MVMDSEFLFKIFQINGFFSSKISLIGNKRKRYVVSTKHSKEKNPQIHHILMKKRVEIMIFGPLVSAAYKYIVGFQ